MRTGEKLTLSNSSLLLTLCQVRFSAIEQMDRYAGLVQDQLRKRGFPINASKDVHRVRVAPSGVLEPERVRQWEFRDVSERRSVFLHKGFVTLQTTDYDDFEAFLERVLDVVATVDEIVGELHVERVGLRYVNAIRGEIWREQIASGLHGVDHGAFKPSTALQLHQTEAVTEAGKLVVRIHQNRSGSVLPPDLGELELKLRARFVDEAAADALWTIVDVDHFARFEGAARAPFDREELASNAWSLKNITHTITFENIFTPEAREAWA